MRTPDLIATIALPLVVISVPALAQQRDIFGPDEIVDGDTIVVNHIRIRLFGMDAPEFDQSCTDNDGKAYSCGHLAPVALKELIGGSPVSCASVDSDRYHRTVAVCKSADGNDLSNDMVRIPLVNSRIGIAYDATIKGMQAYPWFVVHYDLLSR